MVIKLILKSYQLQILSFTHYINSSIRQQIISQKEMSNDNDEDDNKNTNNKALPESAKPTTFKLTSFTELDDYELHKLSVIFNKNIKIRFLIAVFCEDGLWQHAPIKKMFNSLEKYNDFPKDEVEEKNNFLDNDPMLQRLKHDHSRTFKKLTNTDDEYLIDNVVDALSDWQLNLDRNSYEKEYYKLITLIKKSDNHIPPEIMRIDDDDDDDYNDNNNNNNNNNNKHKNKKQRQKNKKINKTKIKKRIKTVDEIAATNKKKTDSMIRNFVMGLIMDQIFPNVKPELYNAVIMKTEVWIENAAKILNHFQTNNVDTIDPTEFIVHCSACIYTKII